MNPEQIRKAARLPEYTDVEAFIEDNETGYYTHEDLQVLNYRLKVPVQVIKGELESYGLRMRERAKETARRGFHANSHDRWSGPGSSPSHGGAGGDQIMGFAGKEEK